MKSATVFKTSFIFLLFLFNSAIIYAQAASSSIGAKELNILGKEATANGESTKALEYYTKAELLARKAKDKDLLMVIKNNLGLLYVGLSNYGEGLNCYREALSLADSDPRFKNNAITLVNNIGVVYSYEQDYGNALIYFKRAHKEAKAASSDYNLILVCTALADLYNKTHDYKSAQKYLNEIKPIVRTEYDKQLWAINYAESLYLEGKPDEAEAIVAGLVDDISEKESVCLTCIAKLRSKIYETKNDIETAIHYAKQGLLEATEIKSRIELYNQLSELYFKKNEFLISKRYKDSVIQEKDKLTKLINRGVFESNKVKLRIRDYQNALVLSQEKQSAERTLFVVGILFSLLLAFFIYRVLQSTKVKQKQEKIISENLQKIVDLELDNLKNSIAEKNRKLSAKAIYRSGRNELIEELIDSISNVREIATNREVSNYVKTLKSHLRTDEEWEDFTTYFEQANPDFLKVLNAKHPQLSASDIRFICYVLMNLDIKEISSIFNVTINAATKRKRRIKEKLGLERDASLYEYLIQLA